MFGSRDLIVYCFEQCQPPPGVVFAGMAVARAWLTEAIAAGTRKVRACLEVEQQAIVALCNIPARHPHENPARRTGTNPWLRCQ